MKVPKDPGRIMSTARRSNITQHAVWSPDERERLHTKKWRKRCMLYTTPNMLDIIPGEEDSTNSRRRQRVSTTTSTVGLIVYRKDCKMWHRKIEGGSSQPGLQYLKLQMKLTESNERQEYKRKPQKYEAMMRHSRQLGDGTMIFTSYARNIGRTHPTLDVQLQEDIGMRSNAAGRHEASTSDDRISSLLKKSTTISWCSRIRTQDLYKPTIWQTPRSPGNWRPEGTTIGSNKW